MDGFASEGPLEGITELMRELSRIRNPQQMVQIYRERATAIVPADRTVSLSRRDLAEPFYRITRSDLWATAINPWKERERLPLFRAGLLGELLYAGQPVIVDQLRVAADDPAAEHLAGMGSLAAIPHFDEGAAVNMVVHLRREPHAFDRKKFPELVMISGMFGRAMRGLVLAEELREAQTQLQQQYQAVTSLSDTILEQARTLKTHSERLEERVRQRTVELEAAHLDAVYMLAAASEAKDEETGDHVRRIEQLSYTLARQLGHGEARALGQSAILHDVGKIHVPDVILKKPGPLTVEERDVMEGHTTAGERILNGQGYFAAARRIARSHHENWDGTGYPDALAGVAIPVEARIVHLADVFDALTHARPYKVAWSQAETLGFIRSQQGRMFDPGIVDAFFAMPVTAGAGPSP